MLLGVVAPYAVRLSVHTVEEAGRVAGRLYAISTLGSLVGIVPQRAASSSRWSARGAPSSSSRWRWRSSAVPALRRRFVLAPVGGGAAAGVARRHHQGDRRCARDLGARDRVPVRAGRPSDPDGERRLELNEGQAVHSVYRPGEWLTDNYWDEMLVLPFAADRSRAALGRDPRQRRRHHRARLRPLLPGARASTAWRSTARSPTSAGGSSTCAGPTCTCTRPTRGRSCGASTRRWDVIIVDAYRQPYIPFYLATREFFGEVRDHLDAGRDGARQRRASARLATRLEKVLSATMGRVFTRVLRDPVEGTNTRARGHRCARLGRGAATQRRAVCPPDLAAVTAAAAARLAPGAARRHGLHRRPRAGGVADRRVDRARRGRGGPVGLPRRVWALRGALRGGCCIGGRMLSLTSHDRLARPARRPGAAGASPSVRLGTGSAHRDERLRLDHKRHA